mmetsp:Transcript_20540/g.41117  ORF Transcript_20540/g.41117 Transcript_20540/m.41117 type:complete len:185 (+) Transcript_20540:738-1292(+)
MEEEVIIVVIEGAEVMRKAVFGGKKRAASNGVFEGIKVPNFVRATDGATDGNTDGTTDGTNDGTPDGITDGMTDGTTDGTADGTTDGTTDGITDGTTDGSLFDEGATVRLRLGIGEDPFSLTEAAIRPSSLFAKYVNADDDSTGPSNALSETASFIRDALSTGGSVRRTTATAPFSNCMPFFIF